MNDALTPDEQPAARRRLAPVTALAAGSGGADNTTESSESADSAA